MHSLFTSLSDRRPSLTSRIGAQVLSHYCDRFPQVSSWMLFIVGCFNTIVVSDRTLTSILNYQGILLRSRAKPKRLIFSWENASTL